MFFRQKDFGRAANNLQFMRVRFMGAKLLRAKKYDIQFLRVGFHSFK